MFWTHSTESPKSKIAIGQLFLPKSGMLFWKNCFLLPLVLGLGEHIFFKFSLMINTPGYSSL